MVEKKVWEEAREVYWLLSESADLEAREKLINYLNGLEWRGAVNLGGTWRGCR